MHILFFDVKNAQLENWNVRAFESLKEEVKQPNNNVKALDLNSMEFLLNFSFFNFFLKKIHEKQYRFP